MHHIKKKFLEIKTPPTDLVNQEKVTSIGEIKKEKDLISIISNDNGSNYMSFLYRENRTATPIVFCMPILPMVFYDNAYQSYRLSEQKRKAILETMSSMSHGTPIPEHEIYLSIGFATSSVIMMCVALENFVNDQIARLNYVHDMETGRRKEVYNSEQIQDFFDLKTKLFKILPKAKNKFINSNEDFKTVIENLIIFRNNLVHIKSSHNGLDSFTENSALIRKTLDYDYWKALKAVRNYMNFFIPNYIEDCPCGDTY